MKWFHRLLFRAVRSCQDWHFRWYTIRQLEAAAALGRAVTVNGPCLFGRPAGMLIGDDVSINRGLVVRGEGALRIGSHVHFGEDVRIITSNHNFETPTALPYDKTRIVKDVYIDDCVWVGDCVVIVPGVHVGEGAVLGAGAVIARDVPPLAVMGGAPAEILRYRDAATYKQLREAGTYLNWPRNDDVVNGRKVRIRRNGSQRDAKR